ncbi:MAG: hypothetical protein QXZ02_03830 [Candidatus Bathyarchaeia archaeon]
MSPIIRKVYEISGSKVIALPKSWIQWLEKEHGCEIKEVAVEVDKVLVIEPVLSKENKRGAAK